MSNSNVEGVFQNLNFGTKPTGVKLEKVIVTIDPSFMIGDFAQAYAAELNRRNPVRFNAIGLTKDDLNYYFTNLIVMRVESVRDQFKHWREAKALLIPSWIEFTMTCIGEVIDHDRGLDIIPECEGEYDFAKMLEISSKLRSFQSDGVQLHRDAFPRTKDGDVDTMSMAIIGDYVYSQSKDATPIFSYVAAYLGFKLKEEQSFKMLYRVRYDDVGYIRSMLLSEESVLQ